MLIIQQFASAEVHALIFVLELDALIAGRWVHVYLLDEAAKHLTEYGEQKQSVHVHLEEFFALVYSYRFFF